MRKSPVLLDEGQEGLCQALGGVFIDGYLVRINRLTFSLFRTAARVLVDARAWALRRGWLAAELSLLP